LQGLAVSLATGQAPYLEDQNGIFLVITYVLAYLSARGIPEWDSNVSAPGVSLTTYNTGDVCRRGPNSTGPHVTIYQCQADNINSDPLVDTTNWSSLSMLLSGPGSAKAWAQFSGFTPTLNGGFNVATLVQNSTANYTITFTTPIGANVAIIGSCQGFVRPISTTVVSGQTTSITFDTAGITGPGIVGPIQYPYVSITCFTL
jgi:hypothetical protein